MKFRFAHRDYRSLYEDLGQALGFERGVVRAFRRRIQLIDSSADERDFRALKSLHFEKLKGDRSHQRSMRLNKKWRLILEFEESSSEKTVVVIGIEDYH